MAEELIVPSESSNSSTGGIKYTPWDEFGVEEYVRRNYGNRLLDEDRLIIEEAAKALQESGISPHSLDTVADIGAGPNFYPAMLLAPYVKESGSINLIEYSPANRTYARAIIDGSDTNGLLSGVWHKFEDAMAQENPQWRGALTEARLKAQVLKGSVYDLPQERFDAITSFFVSESITDDRQQFEQAVRSIVASVKHGGFITIAHMLGSKGYPAGKGTFFPAVPVTTEDLEQLYCDIANVKVVQVVAEPEAREDYRGMAIVSGRRK